MMCTTKLADNNNIGAPEGSNQVLIIGNFEDHTKVTS